MRRGAFPYSNSFLIRDGRNALIDAGAGLEVLRGLKEPVGMVINTHTHPDHCAGDFLFPRAEILVPQEAAQSAGSLERLSRRFAEPGPLARTWRGYIEKHMGFKDHAPTGTFGPGQEIRVGEVRLKAVAAPGHTRDHYCFFLPQWGLLLSADIDLTPFGPWYGHRESDPRLFRRSILSLRDLQPRLLVSSHGPVLDSDIPQALEAFASVLDLREHRLLEFLSRERTLARIVEESLIYGGFPYWPELLRYWEEMMIVKHLEELIARGLALRTKRGYLAVSSTEGGRRG